MSIKDRINRTVGNPAHPVLGRVREALEIDDIKWQMIENAADLDAVHAILDRHLQLSLPVRIQDAFDLTEHDWDNGTSALDDEKFKQRFSAMLLQEEPEQLNRLREALGLTMMEWGAVLEMTTISETEDKLLSFLGIPRTP